MNGLVGQKNQSDTEKQPIKGVRDVVIMTEEETYNLDEKAEHLAHFAVEKYGTDFAIDVLATTNLGMQELEERYGIKDEKEALEISRHAAAIVKLSKGGWFGDRERHAEAARRGARIAGKGLTARDKALAHRIITRKERKEKYES